jgi:heme/copper-type cytochrome/quinol oxidase subunit 2
MLCKSNFFLRVYLKLTVAILFSSCGQDNSNLPVINLSIKDHLFVPADVVIPANTKVSLLIHNEDKTAEEFECPSLRKEKIVPGESEVKVIIAPLKKGVYEFFGEFHPHKAQGKIIVN